MERLKKIKLCALCGLLLVLLVIILLAIYNKKTATTDITTNPSINSLIVSAQSTISEAVAKEKAKDAEEGGQIILPLLSQENSEDYFEKEIEIPRVLEADEDGLIRVTQPRTVLSTKTDIPQEILDEEIKVHKTLGIELFDSYMNQDISATFVYRENDVEIYINMIEDVFNRRLSGLVYNASVNKDFNKLYMYVDENSHGGEFGLDLYNLMWHMVLCQVYIGVPHNEWYIDLYVINTSTNEIILENHFTEEDHGFKMTSEEWEQLFE